MLSVDLFGIRLKYFETKTFFVQTRSFHNSLPATDFLRTKKKNVLELSRSI